MNSDLAPFLKALAEEGRAVVRNEELSGETEDAVAALRQMDEYSRAEAGLDLPPFSSAPALWAAQLLYHLCQFTVCRDIGEERISTVCGRPCPAPRGPEADWSADLALRHLPRVFELARHLSNADPLLQQIKAIAMAWPLSSVGIPGLTDPEIGSFAGHPALWRLYLDRITACDDRPRMGDPRVENGLRLDLGVHHQLAPGIAARVFQTHDDTH